ncbi:serine hydrolase [Streptomyces sp. NPDC026672]|uniref:D-alanyl-D-alanine carboxypeptidase family protein n=1 Tax=unclassified Streptomyces TaxID=2593676 RepID=UPI0033FAC24F
MRDSFRLTRRALLGLTAAALPVSLSAPASAADAVEAVGGRRLALDGVQAQDPAGLPRGLTARSWVVADARSGDVLAAYRAHVRLPPASTLKMLFADTLLDRFARTERHRVTAADLAGIPAGSSLVGIAPGTTYTVEQLWQGVFLRSGNDAVHVLAHLNGGVAGTVAAMQARAVELGALDTHVVSPDGFDHPGQLSSAYDLTVIARHGLANADFRAYCGTRTADFPAGGGRTFQIQNTDRLLTGAWGLGPYKGLIGVKNGYTSDAGNTFTGAATRAGRTLLVTVMHPGSGSNAVYEEAAALLDWGFTKGSSAGAVGTLDARRGAGGASASPGAASGTPRKPGPGSAHAAASGVRSSWRTPVGAAATVALLGAGTLALRRRTSKRRSGSGSGNGGEGGSGGEGGGGRGRSAETRGRHRG